MESEANSVMPRSGLAMVGSPRSLSSATGGRVDRPQSEIEQEFSSVGSSLMELDSVISEISRRLEPVLGPDMPQGNSKTGMEHPIRSSAIGQQLQTVDNEIRYKTRRIVDLLSRLTV